MQILLKLLDIVTTQLKGGLPREAIEQNLIQMEVNQHVAKMLVDKAIESLTVEQSKYNIDILWPPNKITDVNELLSLHKSPAPPFVGTYRPSTQSINLGTLSNKSFTEEQAAPEGESFVVDISDAVVHKGANFVVNGSNKGRLLYNKFIDPIVYFSEQKDNPFTPYSSIEFMSGVTLLVGGTWDENYYHFSCEVLGRFCAFERFCYSFSDIDRVIVSQVPSDIQWEWFRLIGIADKVMVAPESFLVCERLLLPSRSLQPSLETISYLRNKVCLRRGEMRRIFVSRGSPRNGRVIVNEDALFHEFLEPLGFEKVTMCQLSLHEQANTFFSASCIVAGHGAALANLVFANPNISVLEFFGESYVNSCLLRLANQLNIRHYHVICKEVNQKSQFSDYFVDYENMDIKPFLDQL